MGGWSGREEKLFTKENPEFCMEKWELPPSNVGWTKRRLGGKSTTVYIDDKITSGKGKTMNRSQGAGNCKKFSGEKRPMKTLYQMRP